MFYNDKVCDGCSEIMHDTDDIVVCPECGTPQHRECYKKNNECVNAHLHAEGFDWSAVNVKEEKPAEPDVQEASEQTATENERKKLFDTIDNNVPEFPLPEFKVDGVYVNGQTFGADEDIGGATVNEVVAYTQVNSNHYLKKFIKNKHKKSFFFSWNWGTFFFGPAWFFYRKIYKAGAILLALAVSASIAMIPFLPTIYEAEEQLMPLYEQLGEALVAALQNPTEEAMAAYDRVNEQIDAVATPVLPHMIAYLFSVLVLPKVIPAIIANYFYRKKMLEDIKFAKEATSDPKVLKYSLIRRGGVSFLAGLFATLAFSHLPGIIMTVVEIISH